MSYQQLVEAHHALEYGNNVKTVMQQKRNKLRGAVTEVACTGEAHAAADLIGTAEYLESQGRQRSNPENPLGRSRRWLVFPNEIESAEYIEKEDRFQQLYDPNSQLVKGHTMIVQRGIQDRILGVKKDGERFVVSGGGVLGSAVEGKRPGGATVSLPSAYVTAHGGTGLTLDKLRAAKLRLAKDDVGINDEDMDDVLNCAITPTQADDLIGLVAGTKDALNAYQQEQLIQGRPTMLMGLTWIVTNRLPATAGGVRKCPIWSKNNIVLGVWQDVQGAMWNDSHAKNLPYVHVGAFVDCVRVEDKGVHVIECQE